MISHLGTFPQKSGNTYASGTSILVMFSMNTNLPLRIQLATVSLRHEPDLMRLLAHADGCLTAVTDYIMIVLQDLIRWLKASVILFCYNATHLPRRKFGLSATNYCR